MGAQCCKADTADVQPQPQSPQPGGGDVPSTAAHSPEQQQRQSPASDPLQSTSSKQEVPAAHGELSETARKSDLVSEGSVKALTGGEIPDSSEMAHVSDVRLTLAAAAAVTATTAALVIVGGNQATATTPNTTTTAAAAVVSTTANSGTSSSATEPSVGANVIPTRGGSCGGGGIFPPACLTHGKSDAQLKFESELRLQELPVIDLNEALEQCGSPAFMMDVLGHFKEQFSAQKAAIDSYLAEGNWQQFTAETHALKGATANLFLMRLNIISETCMKLGKVCVQTSVSEGPEKITAETKAQLKVMLDSLAHAFADFEVTLKDLVACKAAMDKQQQQT